MKRAMVALAGLFVAACGPKASLIPHFGSSYHAAFAAQTARVGKEPAQAIVGLDSQEAAITSENYLGTLAPKGKEAKQEPMILVAPPSRESPPQLMPSVPKE